MARKQFKQEMEDLFGDSRKNDLADSSLSLFPEEASPKSTSRASQSRKGQGKGFAANLDAFLAEAFETAAQENLADRADHEENSTAAARANRGRRPGSGLDLLIRQTTEESDFIPRQPSTRRMTIVLSKQHLHQLKQLARQRNVYLKDMLGEIVNDFLQEQE